MIAWAQGQLRIIKLSMKSFHKIARGDEDNLENLENTSEVNP